MEALNKFINGIKNLIYYFNVVWKDRDWDYSYIENILEAKLTKTYKRYSSKDYFYEQDKDVVKPLRICIEILKRQRTAFYWDTTNYLEHNGSQYCNVDNCEVRNKEILFKILDKYLYYLWD